MPRSLIQSELVNYARNVSCQGDSGFYLLVYSVSILSYFIWDMAAIYLVL